MKKRFAIGFCCLVLLLQLLPIISFAQAPVSATAQSEVAQDLYYCREQLGELPNGEALVNAYDRIVTGINACADEIEISNEDDTLTPDEFSLVWVSVRRDHTEQFWLGTSYTPVSNAEQTVLLAVRPEYAIPGGELSDAKVAFEQAINNMIGRLTPDMTEYEKEKALHDMLAVKVSYVEDVNAHNAYGALVEGRAVCEGYAEALQCLLQRVGIQSVQVYGDGINPATGGSEKHAWNAVRIDGQYYLTDLTWNDQENILLYAYFNQTSEIFAADHIAWSTQKDPDSGKQLSCVVYQLPVCTATEANYFTKNDLRITTYSVNSIGEKLKNNQLTARLFLDSNPAQFEQWYVSNISNIAKAAGVSGTFSYGRYVIGREVIIYIETCSHTQLTYIAEKAVDCDVDGHTAYRECKTCGKWFLTELDEKGNLIEIMNRDSVKIFSMGHEWTTKEIGETTLKQTAANCTEHDTYWYICSACGVMSDTYTFETDVTGEHVDADGDKVCDVCGYSDQIFGLDMILDLIMNPAILGGGGGVILLIIVLAVLRRAKG